MPPNAVLAQLRARRQQTPFEPFTIRLQDGRVYPVASADHILLVPELTTRVYVYARHALHTILLPSVTSLETAPAPGSDAAGQPAPPPAEPAAGKPDGVVAAAAASPPSTASRRPSEEP